MKVDSASSQKASAPISEEQVRKKIEAKFGKEILEKPKKDEAQISQKSKQLSQAETKIIDKDDVVIGDIGKNNPADSVTQDKLKHLIRSGGFSFNEKERLALQEILKP